MTFRLPGPAWLFCPADRPDRFAKALAAADLLIVDLEDGVAPVARDAARQHLRTAELDWSRTVVRVSPPGTADHDRDCEALRATPCSTVMVAKAETPAALAALSPWEVLALCETPAGVLAAPALAAVPSVIGLMWGGEDLVAGLGGTSSRNVDGSYREVARFARSQILLAASAAGKWKLDAVHLAIEDAEGLEAEARDAAASGFDGTVCIHPSQVEVVRRAYLPAPQDLAWAARVLEAAGSAPGVFRFEGQMVDGPVLRQAQELLDRAARYTSG